MISQLSTSLDRRPNGFRQTARTRQYYQPHVAIASGVWASGTGHFGRGGDPGIGFDHVVSLVAIAFQSPAAGSAWNHPDRRTRAPAVFRLVAENTIEEKVMALGVSRVA